MKVAVKAVLITVLAILVAVFAAGCKGGTAGSSNTKLQSSAEQKSTSNNISVENNGKTENSVKPLKAQSELKTVSVTVYFSDDQALYLVPEIHQVPKTPSLAEAAIKELIKGPNERGHYPTLPSGTRLLGIDISGGVATANFSSELQDNQLGGSASGNLAITSIVDTLTELKDVKKVQILVNGRSDQPIAELDISQPFARDDSVIKK